MAGVALGDIHLQFAWQARQLWHWAGSGGVLGRALVARGAAPLCVAGVALGDIDVPFAWQAWRLVIFSAPPATAGHKSCKGRRPFASQVLASASDANAWRTILKQIRSCGSTLRNEIFGSRNLKALSIRNVSSYYSYLHVLRNFITLIFANIMVPIKHSSFSAKPWIR